MQLNPFVLVLGTILWIRLYLLVLEPIRWQNSFVPVLEYLVEFVCTRFVQSVEFLCTRFGSNLLNPFSCCLDTEIARIFLPFPPPTFFIPKCGASRFIYEILDLYTLFIISPVSYKFAVESLTMPIVFKLKLYKYPKDNFGLKNIRKFTLA